MWKSRNLKLKRWLRSWIDIVFSALMLALMLGVLLTLPVWLPFVKLSERKRLRRLARTKCARCGQEIGLPEIERAEREANAEAESRIAEIMSRGARPRVVVIRRVICPHCGASYVYGGGGRGDLRASTSTSEKTDV
jgi:hypothetical protein